MASETGGLFSVDAIERQLNELEVIGSMFTDGELTICTPHLVSKMQKSLEAGQPRRFKKCVEFTLLIALERGSVLTRFTFPWSVGMHSNPVNTFMNTLVITRLIWFVELLSPAMSCPEMVDLSSTQSCLVTYLHLSVMSVCMQLLNTSKIM
jgi:hypothetical protein